MSQKPTERQKHLIIHERQSVAFHNYQLHNRKVKEQKLLLSNRFHYSSECFM